MISDIYLRDFRSYTEATFKFEPRVNIIVGPNASGKTNLLEAILLISSGSTYRGRDADVISMGKHGAFIEASFGSHTRKIKLIKSEEQVQKIYELDGKEYKRLFFDRIVPTVLFEPNHLQMISRGPEQRRSYFDDVLERTSPGFKRTALSYRRALAQRNALLKKSPIYATKQLFAWNVRLSDIGSQLVESRQQIIESFNKTLSKVYGNISGRQTEVSLAYESPLDLRNYSSSLLSKLEKNVKQDFDRGFTGYGPHREDIKININNKAAAAVASRGELRSIVLALKVIELEMLKEKLNKTPIFLLDDVFSELDATRRRHLVRYLEGFQTIITTTDADSIVEHISHYKQLVLKKT